MLEKQGEMLGSIESEIRERCYASFEKGRIERDTEREMLVSFEREGELLSPLKRKREMLVSFER
ncbi:Protein Son, partial [Manis pentadactyla]